jgi:hypothetical protein
VPERALEDVVSDAVLNALERDAKGQSFPRHESVATRGLVGSAVKKAVRHHREPPEVSNRRSLSDEDERTREQRAEWARLSDRERRERAIEARRALGTSLCVATAGPGRPSRIQSLIAYR